VDVDHYSCGLVSSLSFHGLGFASKLVEVEGRNENAVALPQVDAVLVLGFHVLCLWECFVVDVEEVDWRFARHKIHALIATGAPVVLVEALAGVKLVAVDVGHQADMSLALGNADKVVCFCVVRSVDEILAHHEFDS